MWPGKNGRGAARRLKVILETLRRVMASHRWWAQARRTA